MATIKISTEKCRQCGLCAQVCPSGVLDTGGQGGATTVGHPERCIECGHCIDVCAQDAIQHEAFPQDKIHEVNRALLPSPESVLELIRSRRSNRTITKKDIPQASLDMILEAAGYAPTAENSRLVRLHLITEQDGVQAVEDATMGFFMRLARILMNPVVKCLLRPFIKKLYDEAPALLAMNEEWKRGKRPATCEAKALLAFTAPKGYDFGWQDCNLAYQNASLMAESLGVSQIYMGFVATALKMMGDKRAGKLFGLPKGEKVFALMALGMPAVQYRKYVDRRDVHNA